MTTSRLLCLLCLGPLLSPLRAIHGAESSGNVRDYQKSPGQGYYRFPALHGKQLVFTAEGDLWKVSIDGGPAQRLTTHPGSETLASFSPDGKTLVFSAEYEGPTEVYTMPIEGGLPTRRTFDAAGTEPVGWTPEGKILCSLSRYSTLPDAQLAVLDPESGSSELLPLSQAARGIFEPSGETLFFTRLPFNRGAVKRYKGGTAEKLWKFTRGQPEAVPLTEAYAGVSRNPLWWEGRIFFVTDRDGSMNLWSMAPDGANLRQHTKHKGWDVKWPALSAGRIAYQLGPDLRLYEIASDKDGVIPISLASDFDHQREKWVKKPLEFVTTAHLSSNGDRVVFTARGQVFVAPVGPGRFVEATRQPSVRYRYACFTPDGKSLIALSDESGEVEFVRLPANGLGKPEPLTRDGKVLRGEGVPSPDGKWLAWPDKDQRLWLYDIEKKESKFIAESSQSGFFDLEWAPDSRWLAYAVSSDNLYNQIWLYNLQDGARTALTSDRVYSSSPVWSPDGKWIYFLSERNLESVVSSPWGPRQPEPFFDKTTKIYLAALTKDQRSPFDPPDELHPAITEKVDKKQTAQFHNADFHSSRQEAAVPNGQPKIAQRFSVEDATVEKSSPEGTAEPAPKKPDSLLTSTNNPTTNEIAIDLKGIQARISEVPVPSGNYSDLSINAKRLFWISHESGRDGKRHLQFLDTTNEEPKVKNLAEDIKGYELSRDGKKVLIRKGDNYHVEDASVSAPAKLEKTLDLKSWTFSLNPRDEWRQMFIEAWRLERDYFYDRHMHGVDWPAILKKYLPVVDRVTDRAELSDLIGDMVSELSALHIFVHGGDHREGPDQIRPACLGAILTRKDSEGGWSIDHIYKSDPDYPEKVSPLAQPGVNAKEGDVIEMINGVSTLSVAHLQALLRNQAGKQVLLRLKSPGDEKARETIVKPISTGQESDLRYSEWEFTRRQRVEELGRGELGYIHLRAMSQADIAQWARDYYPVFNRKGLIIDVRHNGGGNIDSWILEKLLRKAWFYWQPRVGAPIWNMQYAFRGHLVVLCDEFTGSDGEAFTEGFKRLGLGKVIGTRTWGGEIWLSASNWLVDRGIATSAEIGVYGPEGQWIIEGHGVDPDIVVDNLPHGTFKGQDAQLQTAIEHLQDEIRLKPVILPAAPAYPDKSLK